MWSFFLQWTIMDEYSAPYSGLYPYSGPDTAKKPYSDNPWSSMLFVPMSLRSAFVACLGRRVWERRCLSFWSASPQLRKVVFYDVACKLDKNALRRVRPILRKHGFRCILDRPHSITHSSSPVYMPDESLGATAGVATQAAEVSHSIAVGNRTSLAYMAPATYMVHKIVQVAMMNIRKLQRLYSAKAGENDHVPLAPFYHERLSRKCERGWICTCQSVVTADGWRPDVSRVSPRTIGDDGDLSASVGALDIDSSQDAGRAAARAVGADPDTDLGGGAGIRAAFDPPKSPGRSGVPVGVDLHGCGGGSPPSGRRYEPLSRVALSSSEDAFASVLTTGLSPHDTVRPVNKAGVTLIVADVLLLRGESWLNDEVMNSFVALVNHRDRVARAMRRSAAQRGPGGQGPSGASALPRSFMLGTFFFSRWSERPGCYDYAGVRQWGLKGNLQLDDVDLIFAPVNIDNAHWVVVIINVRDRQFQYYDSLLGADRASVVVLLQRWLKDEVSSRLGVDVAEQWAVDEWMVIIESAWPQQTDGGCCGVFVLAAADCCATGAPVSFTQADIPVIRRRMTLALVSDDLTSNVSVKESAAAASLTDVELNEDESAAESMVGLPEIELVNESDDVFRGDEAHGADGADGADAEDGADAADGEGGAGGVGGADGANEAVEAVEATVAAESVEFVEATAVVQPVEIVEADDVGEAVNANGVDEDAEAPATDEEGDTEWLEETDEADGADGVVEDDGTLVAFGAVSGR